MGPVGPSLPETPLGVGPCISTFSWRILPFSSTLTNLALAVFLPEASKRGARNSMTYFCHEPGAVEALTLGALAP